MEAIWSASPCAGLASATSACVIDAWATAENEGISRIMMPESLNGLTNSKVSTPMLASPDSTYSPLCLTFGVIRVPQGWDWTVDTAVAPLRDSTTTFTACARPVAARLRSTAMSRQAMAHCKAR
jgi:hypothetical protein